MLNTPQFARAEEKSSNAAAKSVAELSPKKYFRRALELGPRALNPSIWTGPCLHLYVPDVATIYKLWLACHFHPSGVGSQVKQEVQLQDHGLRQLSRPLYNFGNAFPNQATQSLHLP